MRFVSNLKAEDIFMREKNIILFTIGMFYFHIAFYADFVVFDTVVLQIKSKVE